MALIFLGLTVLGLLYEMKKLTNSQKMILLGWFLIALAGLFVYTEFLVDKGWYLGIAGADMRNYYQAAQMLNEGADWKDLSAVSTLYYSEIKIGTITYFIFAQLISWLTMVPIFTKQFNLYLIYTSFIAISGISAIETADFLREGNDSTIKTSTFVFILSCVALIFASYRLLRDVFVYCFVILTLQYIKKSIKRGSIFVEVLMIAVCMLFRSYTVVLIAPYFFYKHLGKRWGIIACIALTLGLVSSMELLEYLKQFVSMPWDFSEADVSEVIQFLLFPNVFNQSKILVDWNNYFGMSSYVGGANLPGMYYLMSVWNIFILGLAFFGIVIDFKNSWEEKIVWSSAMLNVSILYSLLYNSTTTETRQKTMILVPLCYLATKGYEELSRYKVIISGHKIKLSGLYVIMVSILVVATLGFSWAAG